uniref:Uncharacterized protein n=1 Tax=Ascaris lumbricoides TaxID=6252 RepID=A0A0M3IN71_ASCLU
MTQNSEALCDTDNSPAICQVPANSCISMLRVYTNSVIQSNHSNLRLRCSSVSTAVPASPRLCRRKSRRTPQFECTPLRQFRVRLMREFALHCPEFKRSFQGHLVMHVMEISEMSSERKVQPKTPHPDKGVAAITGTALLLAA